jgi:hypothetical protein
VLVGDPRRRFDPPETPRVRVSDQATSVGETDLTKRAERWSSTIDARERYILVSRAASRTNHSWLSVTLARVVKTSIENESDELG